MEIAMARGGRAWRGYFPVGGELTSGKPDRKQGLYFGEELSADDPRVAAGLPLHGANLFPAGRARAEARGAGASWMKRHARRTRSWRAWRSASGSTRSISGAPTPRARPCCSACSSIRPRTPREDGWGVGEHTDYGLLTLLAQDENGGLQVKTPRGWIEAPPIPGDAGVQYRRHARSPDRRALPLDAAPRAQRQRQEPAVVSVLLRSGLGRRDRAAAGARQRPRRQRANAGTAPTCTRGAARTASTCWARWRRCFRSWRAGQ